ncbi:hypothetical protein Bmyc01_57160 [Bacillus mycoides]|nr:MULTISPECIES: hypothetical protein [Bacillus]MED1511882.1 hypothetical protein [Bacillus proteolyticus]GLV67047.1 hypothetical protein Bmyc01_57160 [Bacillus mycoides]
MSWLAGTNYAKLHETFSIERPNYNPIFSPMESIELQSLLEKANAKAEIH